MLLSFLSLFLPLFWIFIRLFFHFLEAFSVRALGTSALVAKPDTTPASDSGAASPVIDIKMAFGAFHIRSSQSFNKLFQLPIFRQVTGRNSVFLACHGWMNARETLETERLVAWKTCKVLKLNIQRLIIWVWFYEFLVDLVYGIASLCIAEKQVTILEGIFFILFLVNVFKGLLDFIERHNIARVYVIVESHWMKFFYIWEALLCFCFQKNVMKFWKTKMNWTLLVAGAFNYSEGIFLDLNDWMILLRFILVKNAAMLFHMVGYHLQNTFEVVFMTAFGYLYCFERLIFIIFIIFVIL